ncbi:G-protein coupled receptor 157-like [Hydra vulgaris]|uniref:G-protein coupled receptor 157-like n=1 Tax=Hydra vulgaris TaxID=6087 RepID=A0ABM4BVQ3_HYDVU
MEINQTLYQQFAMSILNKTMVGFASTLSIIGSLCIIITYISYKDIRTSIRKIIVYKSFADLFTAVVNFTALYFKPKSKDVFCLVQSFISSASLLCSLLWTMILAVFLFITFVKEKHLLANKLFPLFHVVCWGVPVIINCIAYAFNKLGNSKDAVSAGWCWISTTDTNDVILWMILDSKGIEIFSYIFLTVLYVWIKLHLNKMVEQEREITPILQSQTVVVAHSLERKLMVIPLLFVFVRVWGTLRFIIFVYNIKHNKMEELTLPDFQKFLILMQGMGDNLQGAVNGFLFCYLTPKVYNHIKDSIFNCLSINKTVVHKSININQNNLNC